ncbi:MIP/aquaporin family protein [Desulfovibrio sp. TomC]|uniref:MIP/aquaporin family protein n=1 Tax=Desulfovibrio sp. TomC TaxID=1562888 RepID=UPI0005747258|nr:MIP/aquaporin family protein [Desulfovibrio sp. TomC]KHK03534.1 Glycerol uptake facilitator protein [Desulfovibrio sp. TomC]
MSQSSLGKEMFSECLGTMVLIIFGAGCVAMKVCFGEALTITWDTITFGWGMGVFFGVLASLRSGAHINPAVTLALAVTGRFPWGKVLPYALAQTVGGFLGAAIVFLDFKAKWILVDPQLVKTAGIFCTFPAVPGFWPGFTDQVIGTAVLMFGILSIGDFGAKNKVPWIGPVAVAMLVMAIGMSLGAMNGYAINPARDFGPRFFALVAGFTQPNLMDTSIVLVPILGPLVGGPLGALIYDKTTGALNKDPDVCYCEDGAQECQS